MSWRRLCRDDGGDVGVSRVLVAGLLAKLGIVDIMLVARASGCWREISALGGAKGIIIVVVDLLATGRSCRGVAVAVQMRGNRAERSIN